VRILFGVLLYFFCFYVFGAQDVEKTFSDETQKKYERKMFAAIERTGFESFSISVPVKFCKSLASCQPEGNWNYYVTPELREQLSRELFDWFITARFDKVFISNSQIGVATKNNIKIFQIPNEVNGFTFKNSGSGEYFGAVKNYLNKSYANVAKALINSTLKKRAAESAEQEEQTFSATKAKDAGLSTVIIKKLQDTAYAMAIYITKPDGFVIIKPIETNGVTTYSTIFSLNLPVKVRIFKYNPKSEKFENYGENIEASGGQSFYTTINLTKPTQADGEKIFRSSIMLAAKATGVNGSYQIKKDDNFAVFAPVSEVDGNSVKAKIGIAEDLRVDAPYRIMEKIDGDFQNKGWGKARKICFNCEQKGESEFSLISGNAEEADLMREEPWTGFFLTLGGGFQTLRLIEKKDLDKTGKHTLFGNWYGGRAGFAFDLGYATNTRWLSEMWLDMTFFMGATTQGWRNDGQVNTPEQGYNHGNTMMMAYQLDLSRRFYLGSISTYLAPRLGFSFITMDYSGKEAVKVETSASVFNFLPGLELGFNIGPNFTLSFTGQWGIPLSASVENKVNGVKTNSGNYEAESKLNGFVNLAFHFPWVGPFAAIYSKPSNKCFELKKDTKSDEYIPLFVEKDKKNEKDETPQNKVKANAESAEIEIEKAIEPKTKSYYMLDISVEPKGLGIVYTNPEPNENGLFEEDQIVELNIKKTKKAQFKGWEGIDGKEVLKDKIKMTGNKKINAVFEAKKFKLNVDVWPAGAADVVLTPIPNEDECYSGETDVKIELKPLFSDLEFSEWQGVNKDEITSDGTIKINGDKQIKAIFKSKKGELK